MIAYSNKDKVLLQKVSRACFANCMTETAYVTGHSYLVVFFDWEVIHLTQLRQSVEA